MSKKKEIHKDLFSKDNKRVINYINIFNEQSYNFFVNKSEFYQNGFTYNEYSDTLQVGESYKGYTILINETKLNGSNNISNELLTTLQRISENNENLIVILNNKINKNNTVYYAIEDIIINDLKERIEEFDLIRNYQLDLINLERLFDFYNVELPNEFVL